MKKLLAVFLALMMILSVSLMACSKDKDDDGNTNDDDEFINGSSKPTTSENNDTDTDNEGGEETENTGNGLTAEFIEATGTLYVRANGVNIRDAANTSTSNKIGTANLGDSYSYSAYNNAFYKITIGESTTAYISRTYITTNANDVTFEAPTKVEANSKITIKNGSKVNLRCDPVNDGNGTNSTVVGTITSAQAASGELIVLEVNKTGSWAKITYKGDAEGGIKFDGTKTLYCHTGEIVELASSTGSTEGRG